MNTMTHRQKLEGAINGGLWLCNWDRLALTDLYSLFTKHINPVVFGLLQSDHLFLESSRIVGIRGSLMCGKTWKYDHRRSEVLVQMLIKLLKIHNGADFRPALAWYWNGKCG